MSEGATVVTTQVTEVRIAKGVQYIGGSEGRQNGFSDKIPLSGIANINLLMYFLKRPHLLESMTLLQPSLWSNCPPAQRVSIHTKNRQGVKRALQWILCTVKGVKLTSLHVLLNTLFRNEHSEFCMSFRTQNPYLGSYLKALNFEWTFLFSLIHAYRYGHDCRNTTK